jgi:hypothetical protein
MKSNREIAIEFLSETKEKLDKMPKTQAWEEPQVTLDMITSAGDNAALIRMLAVTLHNQIMSRKPKAKKTRAAVARTLSPYNYYISQQYDEEHPGYEQLMALPSKQRQKLIAERWKLDKETYTVPVGYVLRRDRPVVEKVESVSAPSPSPEVQEDGEEQELKSDDERSAPVVLPVPRGSRKPVNRLPRKQ